MPTPADIAAAEAATGLHEAAVEFDGNTYIARRNNGEMRYQVFRGSELTPVGYIEVHRFDGVWKLRAFDAGGSSVSLGGLKAYRNALNHIRMHNPNPYAELELPGGVHVEVISVRHVVTGAMVFRTVIWADRAHSRCLRCDQTIEVKVTCPVTLDPTGQVQSVSQQHVCGTWNGVAEQTYPGTPDFGVVEAAVLEIFAQRHELINERVAATEAELKRQLRGALDRMAEPLAEGETTEARRSEVATGSETQPGVYWDGDTPVAWDYHPLNDSKTVVVDATDLT